MRWLICIGLLSTVACVRKGEQLAQSPERQSEAEYDVARDQFYKGEPRAALDHIRKAIELDDENAKAYYFASTIHLSFCAESVHAADCRLNEAESFARKALQADEKFRDARNLLGQILILEDKPKEAIGVLEPLTKDMAYSATHLAWGNYGWAQVLAGQTDAGIRSLQNAVAEPRFCVGNYRLGIAYQKKGDWISAEQAFSRALEVESPECQNLQDAWLGRAESRRHLGKTEGAKTDFERCVTIGRNTTSGVRCSRELSVASL